MLRKMKVLLAGLLTVSCLAASAGAASYDNCADRLSELGLFRGTGSGYELDRAPTRAEAGVMLVRLLGAEEEAQALEYTAPFTDLVGWERPYVQYLYDTGLTTGATATTFDPGAACSAQMYTTFLLRALGYSDAAGGDFSYAEALQFGTSIGLVDYANCSTSGFMRDHVAAMSLTALNTAVKGDADTRLLEKLVADGAVEASAASGMLAFFDNYDAYTQAASSLNQENRMDITVDVSADVTMEGTQVMRLSMPMDMAMDMDLDMPNQSRIAMTGSMDVELDESMVEAGAPTSVSQDIAYYYTDGVYYMDLGEQKVKMAMDFEDALAQVSGLENMQSSEPICLIDSIAVSGNEMTVTYTGAGMSSMVNMVLGEMGMDAGMDMQIGDVTYKLTVSNGTIRAMTVSMQMKVTAEGETMTMDMTMDCTVNRTGDSVKVEIPSDLSGYTDLAELTADA